MSAPDVGGDPPCWANLFDDDAGAAVTRGGVPLVIDLAAVPSGSGGAIWSLPHGGDLDANLVRLDPGAEIGAHTNNDVDVLVLVQSGTGELTIDQRVCPLGDGHLALIPRGTRRSIVAGATGITYMSIHRQRSPLGIGRRADTDTAR